MQLPKHADMAFIGLGIFILAMASMAIDEDLGSWVLFGGLFVGAILGNVLWNRRQARTQAPDKTPDAS